MELRPDLQKQDRKSVGFNFKKERRIVAYSLIASIVAVNSIILLAPTTEEQNFYGNIMGPLTAAIASAFSIVVVYRQKLDGLFGRAYAALSIGLALFLTAEIIWGYYSIVLQIEVPFPSIADAFWLAGYAPFGYHLFTISKFYGAYKRKSKSAIIVSLGVAAFSAFYIQSIVSVSELSGPDALLGLGVSIAYPIADAIMIVPAFLAILGSGRGDLTAIPWIFISWIFTALADTLFGFTFVTNLLGAIPMTDLAYNASYLFMAAGLYWHNKFFVVDESKMERLWQSRNR
jgi:hypothetical protein